VEEYRRKERAGKGEGIYRKRREMEMQENGPKTHIFGI